MRKKNSEVRLDFLERSRVNGKLICYYCKRDDLVVDDYFLRHKCHTTEERAMRERCATMDHFYPLNPVTTDRISDHDRRKQRVVSCPECNDAKDSLSPEEFEKLKDRLIIPWELRQELMVITERMTDIRNGINKILCFRRSMKTERHEPPSVIDPSEKKHRNRRRNEPETNSKVKSSWNPFKAFSEFVYLRKSNGN